MTRPKTKKSTRKNSGASKGAKQKAAKKAPAFTPIEQRAARARRIRVEPADPYGWFAHSERGGQPYHLYLDPDSKRLQCVCADFVFRGEDNDHTCKHVFAVLLFVATEYLKNEYTPETQSQQLRAA